MVVVVVVVVPRSGRGLLVRAVSEMFLGPPRPLLRAAPSAIISVAIRVRKVNVFFGAAVIAVSVCYIVNSGETVRGASLPIMTTTVVKVSGGVV